MGSTMFEGWFVTISLQLNQIKLPKPQRLEVIYKLYKVYTTYTRYTNDIQYIQDIQMYVHTLGPSMPQVALTPLGLPSLASNHSSTQGSNK
jgi:hypothetical protein